MQNLLTDQQARVADRVLDEESQKREHLVVSLSGAHAYGFPSPDSDLDLKAVHVLSTEKLLGLSTPVLSCARMEVIDSVEIDYSSNELGAVLQGVLKGNGNYIERLLGRTVMRQSQELEPLQALVKANLSRRVYHHYRGFSFGQWQELNRAERKSAKRLLYVLRTLLTGLHLLRTGELVTDLTELLDAYGQSQAWELVHIKRAGERAQLQNEAITPWQARVQELFDTLEQAERQSVLPAEPLQPRELEGWLLAMRRKHW